MVDKLPFLPDEHHYAIAAVATRAAQLEHTLELAVQAALSRSPRTAQLVLKNLGADRIVALFQAVYADALPDFEEQIGQLAAEIQRARGERNEIMHWLWGQSEEPGAAVHVLMRPFRESKPKTKTAAQVQEVADLLLKCTGAIIWYENALLERRRSSLPDIPGWPPLPPSFASPSKSGRKRKPRA